MFVVEVAKAHCFNTLVSGDVTQGLEVLGILVLSRVIPYVLSATLPSEIGKKEQSGKGVVERRMNCQ